MRSRVKNHMVVWFATNARVLIIWLGIAGLIGQLRGVADMSWIRVVVLRKN
jgi:hypothetical protein